MKLVRRFVVVDRSMEPTLHAGQGLVGVRTNSARPGELRCIEHPAHPDVWLVKRVESASGERMTVTSDNRTLDTIDSRRFGSIPVAGSFRVVLRIPLRLM